MAKKQKPPLNECTRCGKRDVPLIRGLIGSPRWMAELNVYCEPCAQMVVRCLSGRAMR